MKTQQGIVTGVILAVCLAQDQQNSNALLAHRITTYTVHNVTHTHAQVQHTQQIMTVAYVNYANGDAKYVQVLTIAQCVQVDFTFMMDGAIFNVQPTLIHTQIWSIKDTDAELAR